MYGSLYMVVDGGSITVVVEVMVRVVDLCRLSMEGVSITRDTMANEGVLVVAVVLEVAEEALAELVTEDVMVTEEVLATDEKRESEGMRTAEDVLVDEGVLEDDDMLTDAATLVDKGVLMIRVVRSRTIEGAEMGPGVKKGTKVSLKVAVVATVVVSV